MPRQKGEAEFVPEIKNISRDSLNKIAEKIRKNI